MARRFQVQIVAAPYGMRDENRMGWLSRDEIRQMRQEMDRELERQESVTLPDIKKPETSMLECAQETGLMEALR